MVTTAKPLSGTNHVLTPVSKRHDWFAIPAAWTPSVSEAPCVQLDARLGPVIHRSHLPLLAVAHPEISSLLTTYDPLGLVAPSLAVENKRLAFDLTTEPNGWKLRNYQHVGREFIRSRRGTLLADSMRVGKSAQVVGSHEENSGPLFIVAPLATREVWVSWCKKRWPEKRALVLRGKYVQYQDPSKQTKKRKDPGYDIIDAESYDPNKLNNAEIIFCNYDILTGWKNFGNRRIGTLVFDEIHLLSNKNSRRSTAAMYISALADRVIGATGTPLWNKPAGLFTTLACICPGAFGKYFEYATRYANGHAGSHGFIADGSSNEEEFKLRMSEVMIRRSWLDILGQLPSIERTIEVVEITERQIFEVEKEAENVRNHAKRVTSVGALARFRRLLAKLKINGAIDAAKRVLDGGERVIIWTWHRDIALKIESELAKANYPGFVVTGSTNATIREEILNRWRKSPTPTPLCITLAVGQVGIDLSAARQEIFAELDFTPSIVAQAEMRPFTATQPISATYIIIDHEIERKILDALSTKCDAALKLGVPAAESSIEVLANAFSRGSVSNEDDFAALAAAVMSDHPDIDESGDDDYHGAMWDFDWEAE